MFMFYNNEIKEEKLTSEQTIEEINQMEYSDEELSHAKLLEELAIMCRSNKERFTVTDRIEKIRELLSNTEYQECVVSENSNFPPAPFSLWSKKPIQELPEDIILISTHADIVPFITQCSSKLREDGFYSGTYDNIGTNAAVTLLMLEHDMPDNIVFAYTGDEETGNCQGARGVAKLLSAMGKNLTCIALDVTYEGFWDNRLFSIENCTAPKEVRTEFLSDVAKNALATEESQSFCFVKAKPKKKYIPDELDEKYVSPSTGMYDEAFAYKEEGYKTFSFCLPCNGEMHSNTGVLMKQPVFEGYVLSLASLLYEMTKTHPQLIEAYKIAKDNLIKKATEITYHRPTPSYHYESPSPYYYHNGYFYSGDSFLEEDDDIYLEDEEEAWYEMDELSSLTNILYSEAVMYGPEEEDAFVENTDIPQEYMKAFCYDPDGAILPEEEERIEKYLRGLFRNVHGLEKLDYDIDSEEYYANFLTRLEEERQMEYDDDYEECASLY